MRDFARFLRKGLIIFYYNIMKSKLSRRELLKIAGRAAEGGAVAVGIKLLNLPIILASLGKEITPYISKTESGNFIQFYGIHGGKLGPINLGFDTLPTEVFSRPEIDAVFLEGVFVSGGPYPEGNGSVSFNQASGFLQTNTWYKGIVPKLVEGKVPILLGDIYPTASRGIESVALNTISYATAIGGTIGSFTKTKGATITKREFLKRAGLGILAFWGYQNLVGELAKSLLPHLDQLTWVDKLRETVAFTEFTHPENVLLNFRNALIAEKILFYAEKKETESGRKPTIAIVMGEGHELLSEYLKKGRRFCRNYLDLYPETFIKNFFGENLNQYYSSLFELKAGDGIFDVRIMYDPELQRKFISGETERESFVSSEAKG